MNNKISLIRLTFVMTFFMYSISIFTQQLTKQKANELTLKNNYGILMAKNDIEISENNKAILNSGYLPSIAVNAAALYQNKNTTTAFNGVLNAE